MSIERSRALVQVAEQEPVATIIDSSNITKFLSRNIDIDSRTQFASEIDMSFYTPVFEYLYKEEKQGYVSTDVERERFLDTYNAWSQEEQLLAKPTYEYYTSRGVVERSSIVYRDVQTGQFGYSAANHGDINSVEFEIDEVLQENRLPILEVHTHPEDALFSPVDYWRMLIGVKKNQKLRLTNGIVVLCPTGQLMALPTKDTPILTGEKIDKLIEDVDARNYNQRRMQQLVNRYELVLNLYSRTKKNAYNDFEIIRAKKDEGVITLEEYSEQYSNLLEKTSDMNKRLSDTSARILKFNLSYGKRMDNNLVVDFAREINVKLYVSGDMKNFHEFSL